MSHHPSPPSRHPLSPQLLPPQPPEAWHSLVRLKLAARRPLDRFLQIEAASGILLLIATAIALVWVHTPWADGYLQFWKLPIGVSLGSFRFERTLEWIVNDVLMVIFFFVVGLEIRREIHRGELSEWRRAALPVVAALGGMLVPAGLYLLLAGAPDTRSGWGVPMATDIAFAVGVLAMLGNRVPPALRVLLLAVAVIDDLGAIVVIALFYSDGISASGLLIFLLGLVGIYALQRLGIRSKLAYVLPASVSWAGIYVAGIHPTIAGVIVGLMTPVTAWLGPDGFMKAIGEDLEKIQHSDENHLSSHDLAGSLKHLNFARREVLSPADSLIETLHPWVAFLIMPIFALANAGVSLTGTSFSPAATTVAFSVAISLLFGKPIGILLFSWTFLKLRIVVLPKGIATGHLLLLGLVAGIGFTMALFIAQLAFKDELMLSAAKIGILGASGVAAVLALILGRVMLSTKGTPGAALSADEAEASTAL